MGPIRTCIGCRAEKPASDLVRYVLDADGVIQRGRHLPGRGAWVCDAPECHARAIARSAFSRAFRASVTQPVALAAIESPQETTSERQGGATETSTDAFSQFSSGA